MSAPSRVPNFVFPAELAGRSVLLCCVGSEFLTLVAKLDRGIGLELKGRGSRRSAFLSFLLSFWAVIPSATAPLFGGKGKFFPGYVMEVELLRIVTNLEVGARASALVAEMESTSGS